MSSQQSQTPRRAASVIISSLGTIFILQGGQGRARLPLGLGGEGDLSVEQAAHHADGQAHKIWPREKVVTPDHHA